MSNYYVDPVNGNDTYDGTVPDYTSGTTGPWLTITAALAGVADGAHTIWLAPGVHRMASGITLSQSGTDVSNKLYWKGDPNCLCAWDATVEPGIVRMTRSDSNNVPTAGDFIAFGTETNVEIWDAQIDGVAGTGTVYDTVIGARNAGTQLRRCVVIGGNYGVTGVGCTDCVAFARSRAFNECYGSGQGLLRCFGWGTAYGGYDCDADQCALFGTMQDGWRDTTATTADNWVRNSLLFGYSYGFNYTGAGTTLDGCDNNAVWMSNAACKGFGTTNDPASCLMVLCNNDSASAETTGYDKSSWRTLYHSALYAATPPTAGHCFELSPALDILAALAVIFKPQSWGDQAMVDGTATSETKDMLGCDRTTRFNSETATRAYPGPWAISDVVKSYDATNGNVLKIRKKGSIAFWVPLKKLTATSINVKCACGLGGGSTYPQIELLVPSWAGAPTTATDSATGTAEETLTVGVNATAVTADCMAQLICRTTEVGAGAEADFYGITVT